MSEEEKEIVNETKQLLENLTGLDISERFNNKYTGFNFLINSRNVDILIKVIEKQQNRIDELEKALIDEDLKYKEKIKYLNGGINKLMAKRRKWKNRYYKTKAKLYKLTKEGV